MCRVKLSFDWLEFAVKLVLAVWPYPANWAYLIDLCGLEPRTVRTVRRKVKLLTTDKTTEGVLILRSVGAAGIVR